jgi:hypothetical protein
VNHDPHPSDPSHLWALPPEAAHTTRTATAAAHPCQLYAHTQAPRPSRTQYHHRYPQYLQERVYGEVRYQKGEDMLWLCGLCHDSIHDWLSWLLGEARKPDPAPSPRAVAEAVRTANWYWTQTNAHTG